MRERRPATPKDPVQAFEDFDHFESAGGIPEGRFEISYNGAPVDFLYAPVHDAKATVVFFHGSTPRDVNLPMFSGQGIIKGIPANRLAISDPSLTLDASHDLILSWFMGSSTQPRLQFFLENVIRRIQTVTGVPRLIFLGGSGGGFASLEMARRFSRSVALVMNPQTNLTNYYRHLRQKYLGLCWDGKEALAELPPYVNHDHCSTYPRVLNHTVAYMQNTRDEHHVEGHLIPFSEKVGSSENMWLLLGAWGDPKGKGHVAPPRELTRSVLGALVDSPRGWDVPLRESGFTQGACASTIRSAVIEANAGLPTDHEVDVM